MSLIVGFLYIFYSLGLHLFSWMFLREKIYEKKDLQPIVMYTTAFVRKI